MKLPLIISLLILVSCANKEQALIPNKKPFYESQETLEPESKESVDSTYKSFLTIPHTDGVKDVRNVLLNALTESEMNKAPLNIKERVELESTPMSTNELSRYSANESEFAKIIISTTTSAEVFFIPADLVLKKVASELGVINEENRVLKWLGASGEDKTIVGKTYYLISVNHLDLIKNDLSYYSHTINLTNRFKEMKLNYWRGSKLEILVDYKFFKETIIYKEQSKPGICTFNQGFASGNFAAIESHSVSQLGFLKALNNNWEDVSDLNTERISANSFKITVTPEMILDKEFTIQFDTKETAALEEKVPNYPIQGTCGWSYKLSTQVQLKTKSDFNVSVKVFGRGERLREIKL